MERANQVQIHASLVFHLNCLFTNVRPRTTQDRELLNDEKYEEEIKWHENVIFILHVHQANGNQGNNEISYQASKSKNKKYQKKQHYEIKKQQKTNTMK